MQNLNTRFNFATESNVWILTLTVCRSEHPHFKGQIIGSGQIIASRFAISNTAVSFSHCGVQQCPCVFPTHVESSSHFHLILQFNCIVLIRPFSEVSFDRSSRDSYCNQIRVYANPLSPTRFSHFDFFILLERSGKSFSSSKIGKF